MKMLNGNICCTSLDEITEKVGNVIVPTNKKSYRTLKVVNSDVKEVAEGKTILVPINCKNEVEIEGNKYVIVNVREIILIVD